MRSWDGSHSVAADDIRDLLRGRVVTDPDPRGLRLRAARIRGRLDLDNLATTVKLTLLDCVLDEGITAEAAHLPGLSLRRCLLAHPSKPALYADELRTNGGVSFEGCTVLVSTADGAIRMIGAHIAGQLDCSGITVCNLAGPALHGDALQVDGEVFLNECFTAGGFGEQGAVRLRGAHIGGALDCSGAIIHNPCGPALIAERLQVDGSASLSKGRFNANDSEGAVRLSGARIGGQLDCSGATIHNLSGSALKADALQVDFDVVLGAGFTADGVGKLGVMRLFGARIGGVLHCSGAMVDSRSGPHHRWSLDGLTYTGLPTHPFGKGREGWLDLFRTATPAYAAQPYQQLALTYRASGHDRDVRKILIAQQEDLRKRGDLGGWPTRAMHYMWGKLGGYGYSTRRTVYALFIVLLIAAGLGIIAGRIPTGTGRYVAMHSAQAGDPQRGPCSLLEQIGIGIDRGLPLGTMGIRGHCDVDTVSRTGQVMTAFIWAFQFFVWVLATFVVAGYVGLIRKVT
jgi:hypothetical protein